MANGRGESPDPASRSNSRGDLAWLVAIASVVAVAHCLTNGRYGFHRDELQFLSDARHLDWGFVAYPPFTPAVERVAMAIFGLWMPGLRVFSVLAQAMAVVVTGVMARELGGGRLAQVAAALGVAFAALPMFEATEFQYTTFDYLWWVLASYFLVRLLRSGDARWWLGVGAALGIGLETKYAICFLIFGLLVGMVLSQTRRYFLNGWFWVGVAVALGIFLPNLLWQLRHGFISYQFLQHIHARDVGEGRAEGFWRQQLWICTNTMTVPVWILGLVCLLCSKRYRMLGWMAAVTVGMFWLAKGRGYYTAGVYPVLLAMGAAESEKWLRQLRLLWGKLMAGAYFAGLAVCGAYVCALVLPLAANGPLRDFALKNNGDLREEIGWNEMVATVAEIRDGLTADQRQHLGIVVGNYGEGGAIEILGAAHGLPEPISGTNSAWLRGYPTPEPTTLIVVGFSWEGVEQRFTGCRLAGRNGNSEGVRNEESEYHPEIFLCGPPQLPWPQFWALFQRFG